MPAISLITICWNSERTLARTLQSVLKQTHLPDEYLFVDGGSTDRTLAILEEFKVQAERAGIAVRILKQRRTEGEAGIPSAWNQGIAEVHGDVIGLLNSDDWLETTALEAVVKALEGKDACGAVSCPVRFVSADGDEVKVFAAKCLGVFLPFQMALPHPGLFVRRTTYERIGLYDVKYRISADYDWVWRLYRAKIPVAYVPEAQVNMELGGLANSSRELARNETLEIALRHGAGIRARAAWLIRRLTGR